MALVAAPRTAEPDLVCTAQLTQDAKERCLVSSIATERLTTLADEADSA